MSEKQETKPPRRTVVGLEHRKDVRTRRHPISLGKYPTTAVEFSFDRRHPETGPTPTKCFRGRFAKNEHTISKNLPWVSNGLSAHRADPDGHERVHPQLHQVVGRLQAVDSSGLLATDHGQQQQMIGVAVSGQRRRRV